MGDEKCRAGTDCRVNLGASPVSWDTRVRGGQASAVNTSFKELKRIQGAVLKAKSGIVPAAQRNLCDSPSNRKENVNKSVLRVKYLQLQIDSLCQYQHNAQITGCQGDTGDQGCSLCWLYCKFKKMEPWHPTVTRSKVEKENQVFKKVFLLLFFRLLEADFYTNQQRWQAKGAFIKPSHLHASWKTTLNYVSV